MTLYSDKCHSAEHHCFECCGACLATACTVSLRHSFKNNVNLAEVKTAFSEDFFRIFKEVHKKLMRSMKEAVRMLARTS
jgi:hypothetical protein